MCWGRLGLTLLPLQDSLSKLGSHSCAVITNWTRFTHVVLKLPGGCEEAENRRPASDALPSPTTLEVIPLFTPTHGPLWATRGPPLPRARLAVSMKPPAPASTNPFRRAVRSLI